MKKTVPKENIVSLLKYLHVSFPLTISMRGIYSVDYHDTKTSSINNFLFPPIKPSSMIRLLISGTHRFNPVETSRQPTITTIVFLYLPSNRSNLFTASLLSIFFLRQYSYKTICNFLDKILIYFTITYFQYNYILPL